MEKLKTSRNKAALSSLRDVAVFWILAKLRQYGTWAELFWVQFKSVKSVTSPKFGNFVGYKAALELSFIEIPFGSIIIDA